MPTKPSEVVMEVGFAGGGSLPDFARQPDAHQLTGPESSADVSGDTSRLCRSRIPFDVVTGKRLHSNMLIRALEVTTDRLYPET